jgi:tRNA-2-methylthio-N6-dimethylallyladenosine synthase
LGKRHLYIQTFGCQMNVHDSEKIMKLMLDSGYEDTGNMREADLIIINTCSIREKAEQKVYSQLGRLRKLKEERPDLIIGIGGCLAQEKGSDVLRKYPFVDIVFGTHHIHRIPEFVKSVENAEAPVVETAFQESVASLDILALPQNGNISAYITIMQVVTTIVPFVWFPI